MQSLASWSALVVMAAAGCALDEAPGAEPAGGCPAPHERAVLDVELRGLHDGDRYRFVVAAAGVELAVDRTDERRATFAERPLEPGGSLVVSLDDETLRVFVDGAAGGGPAAPAEVGIAVWARHGLLVAATFTPDYRRAVPAADACFAVVTDTLAVPPVAP